MNAFGDVIMSIKETNPHLFANEFNHVREFVTVYMSKPQKPAVFNETLTRLCAQNAHIRRPIIAAMCRTSASPASSGEVYIKTDDLTIRFWSALRSLELPDEVANIIEQVALLCEESSSLDGTESCHVYNDDDFDLHTSTSNVLDPGPSLREPSVEFVNDQRTSQLQQGSEVSSNRMDKYTLSQYDDDFDVSANAPSQVDAAESSQYKALATNTSDIAGSVYEDDFEQSLEAKGSNVDDVLPLSTVCLPVDVSVVSKASTLAHTKTTQVTAMGHTREKHTDFFTGATLPQATAVSVSTSATATVKSATPTRSARPSSARPPSAAHKPATTLPTASSAALEEPSVCYNEDDFESSSIPIQQSRVTSVPTSSIPTSSAHSNSTKAEPVKTTTTEAPAIPTTDRPLDESSVFYDDGDFEPSTPIPSSRPPYSSVASPELCVTLVPEGDTTSQHIAISPCGDTRIGNVDSEEMEFPDLFDIEESTQSSASGIRYDDEEVGALVTAMSNRRGLRRQTSVEKLLLELDPIDVSAEIRPTLQSKAEDTLGEENESVGRSTWSPLLSGSTPADSQLENDELREENKTTKDIERSTATMTGPRDESSSRSGANIRCEDEIIGTKHTHPLSRGNEKSTEKTESKLDIRGMSKNGLRGDEAHSTSLHDSLYLKNTGMLTGPAGGSDIESMKRLTSSRGTTAYNTVTVSEQPNDQHKECYDDYADDFSDTEQDYKKHATNVENEAGNYSPAGHVPELSVDDVTPIAPVYYSNSSSSVVTVSGTGQNHTTEITNKILKSNSEEPSVINRRSDNLQTPSISNYSVHETDSEPLHSYPHHSQKESTAIPASRQRPKSAVITSSYDNTNGSERNILRSASATQRRLSAAQHFAYGK